MAFNRRIMQKLEEACGGNEAMKGYMRDLVVNEMKGVKQYKAPYEGMLKLWSGKEAAIKGAPRKGE